MRSLKYIKSNSLPISISVSPVHSLDYGTCHKGSVIFYQEGGLLKIGGIRYFFLDQKGDQKIFSN